MAKTDPRKGGRNTLSALSEAMVDPQDVTSAVKSLLQKIQAEIRQDDHLLALTKTEIQDIDEIIMWMESKEL